MRLVLARASLLALLAQGSASAAEVRVFISSAFYGAYAELGPAFERASGHRLITTRGPSMGESPDAIPARLERGESADVVMLDDRAADVLAARGLVRAGSKVVLARSQIGLVVRAGAAKPNIGSVEAFRKTLIEAASLAYSDSSSGVYLSTTLFAKLGIAAQVAGKSRKVRGPPSGEPVAAVVARGEVAIGFQQVSELIHAPGVDFVGAIPAELQPGFSFAGAIASAAPQPDAALALLRFLASPEAARAIVKAGLMPPQDAAPAIPLPEHPRPDFERAAWLNLNGSWAFRFDKQDAGERERWFESDTAAFPLRITVPFPWGSKLSGVPDEADVAWYARTIRVPEAWKGQRVFLVVGASDWKTSGWLDGKPVGSYQGGYTPFELELTGVARPGAEQRLVLRVDDTAHAFKLEGKQGYGKARGLWQTAYLEARPPLHVGSFELRPAASLQGLDVIVRLSDPATADTSVVFETSGRGTARRQPFATGSKELRFAVAVPGARLWTLEDPFLHDATLRLRTQSGEDVVKTYFGMRSIGTARVPGIGRFYVTLNGKPLYLQMTLDQGYHPDGFYSWPTDAAMREEILIARRLGLNAIRTHVKIELPRKLYWADRLGMLVMADVPNSWGEPDAAMRGEWETALRGMLRRDFNHPSIFSWVLFNEQWGLLSPDAAAPGKRTYRPETQEWVGTRVDMTKGLDPTRLVEDNSPCCGGGHVKTDFNSWHAYLPGWKWKETLAQAAQKSNPGSTWNYMGGRVQDDEPMLNSECGNVWGYQGSTGDVDWSYDYHAMIDAFRRQPEVAGWLYTEHHDVINEWNGYVKADRTTKETGLSEIVPGMTLRDLHSPHYVVVGSYPATSAKPGEPVSVPLFASFLTDVAPAGPLKLKLELAGHDDLGRSRTWWRGERELAFAPWSARELEPLSMKMPERRSLAILRLSLEDTTGRVLHRNFTSFVVGDGAAARDERVVADGRSLRVLRFETAKPSEARWSLRSWSAMDGGKQNGAGSGHFEFRMAWPKDLRPADVAGASFLAELGAKQLFGKDRPQGAKVEGDFMLGRGTHDPSLNANSYPMTDATPFPSAVRVSVNGVALGLFDLADDPADHRGILSWHAQKRTDKPRLDEAGSFGYLVTAGVPAAALEAAAGAGEIVLRLEVDAALPGGLAVYGERTGRYPFDPSLLLTLR